MSTQVIAPYGFFTYDAFRAGWYLTWRLFVFTSLPCLVIEFVIGFVVVISGGAVESLHPFFGLLGVAAFIASIVLTNKFARSWALRTWARTFVGWVWWSIFWRVFLVALLLGVLMGGLAGVFTTVSGASAAVIGLLLVVLVPLFIVVMLLSNGWAMSGAVAKKLGGGVGVATSVVAGLNPLGYTPTTGPQYTAPRPAPVTPVTPMRTPPPPSAPGPVATPLAAAPVMTPRAPAPPPPPSPSGAAPAGRRQCPKCSLYETEKGTVLGWYCKVCGWSESRA